MMRKSVPFAFNVFYFAAISFTVPFVVLYYQGLGFSGAQIGLLAGLVPLVIMVGAPLWTRLADAKSCHRQVISLTILCSIFFTAIFPLLKNFYLVLPVSVLYAFFVAPIVSLADSATMNMLGSEKNLYGRIRLGGTIGWGTTALIAGYVIQTYGTQWIFWGFSLLMVIVFIISQKLIYPARVRQASEQLNVKQAFANRQWAVFLLLAIFAGLGLSTMNTFLSPYLKELGISQTYMGTALSISVIAELPVLFYSTHLLRRFGAPVLLFTALALSGLRLLLYAGAHTIQGILIFQLLNGLTYPLFIVAAVSHANAISPDGMKATGQGIMNAAVSGVGSSIGGLVCGLLITSVGGQTMFALIGFVLLAAVAGLAVLERKRFAEPQSTAG